MVISFFRTCDRTSEKLVTYFFFAALNFIFETFCCSFVYTFFSFQFFSLPLQLTDEINNVHSKTFTEMRERKKNNGQRKYLKAFDSKKKRIKNRHE